MFLYLLFFIKYLSYSFISFFTQKKYNQSFYTSSNLKFIPFQNSTTKKKPEWVKKKIIRIKAINPKLSHRKIASIFNTNYDYESVSKTYVGYILKNYKYEVLELRKKFHNKKPYSIKFNFIWGIDLTFINQKPILGVIEHHSRKLISLQSLQQKSSVKILKALLFVLEKYPKPEYIRSDNEVCFTSKLIKFSLWFLGIKHQTTDLNSPWQNGRIERLFGTFKSTILFMKYDKEDLQYLCHSFQWWYNNIRLHQNLDYKTPEYIYQKNIDKIYNHKQKE